MHQARRYSYCLLAAACFCLTAGLRGEEPADAKLFDKVMKRLLSSPIAVREYPKKFAWPPKAMIKPKSKDEINAYAAAHPVWGATFDTKSKKIRPVVMVTEGMLKQVIK